MADPVGERVGGVQNRCDPFGIKPMREAGIAAEAAGARRDRQGRRRSGGTRERGDDRLDDDERRLRQEGLQRVYTLFALSTLESDRGWFLETGVFEPTKSRAIRARVNELCREVASLSPDLVDAFAIPEGVLPELVREAP